MTVFPYDQFAKDYLKELLSPLGEVETSRSIGSEVREIDVLFTPRGEVAPPTELGLLGRLATTAAIFEPYRNAINLGDVRSCIDKLLDVFAFLERQARRNNTPVEERELPFLWIISPTASEALLTGFGAKLELHNWGSGVYVLPTHWKTGIVVIHQLPKTEETLWLRLLGKGRVQQQAINELAKLPENDPWRVVVLELLSNLKTILEVSQNLAPEEQDLIMQLSPLYEQRLAEATQQGIEQGIERGIEQGVRQGQRMFVENLLRAKFGELDEELIGIIESLLALPPADSTVLLLQLSREELLARFN
ncbi:hypothetical protein [Floridanema evergladense]|uniref:Flagellar assembly protein H n=1 Tax=Floridaenema evergladense BLCC-F167 TaxID=3153639 RepID=A0ABV4WXF2_9CYAN